MSNGSRRSARRRTAVALGLVVALIFGLGLQPGVSPVIAQDETPEAEPAAPPSTQQSPGQPAPKPSGPTSPSGPAPAFAPSGPGTGSGTGSGSGAPAPKPAGQPASQPSGQPVPQPSGSFSPPPPPLGAVVYENALKDERVFKAGRCFGGYAFTQYVGEGFKMVVNGPCSLLLDESTWITVQANGVQVGDGEVAIEVKVVDSVSRTRVGLYVRNAGGKLIGAQVQPGKGEATLYHQVENQQTELASRYDLFSTLKPNEWNRVAVRVSGFDTWLIVNDEPVLYTREVHADAGGVIIEIIREGDVYDEDEAAAVFRNLTLTALEGGEPGRAPKGP